MNNIPIKFKNFEFSVNPQDVEIKAASNLSQVAVPFDAYDIQELGIKPLVVSGKGEFCSDTSTQEFDTLYHIFLQGGAGELIVSGTQPMMAIMTKLVKSIEPLENTIGYSFEFVEVPQKQSIQLVLEQFHTVKEGETLWHISRDFGVEIKTLFKLNENISDPWNVSTGDRVRIR